MKKDISLVVMIVGVVVAIVAGAVLAAKVDNDGKLRNSICMEYLREGKELPPSCLKVLR